MAQHYGDEKSCIGGCIGVIVSHHDGSKPTNEEIETAQHEAEEKERLACESAVPLGGNSTDIFSLCLGLSIGNIAEDQFFTNRREVLEQLYNIYPEDEGNQAAQEILKSTTKSLEIIRRRIESGETVRIWYSDQPDELCGLYWFLSQLKQWGTNGIQIVAVKLPEWEEIGETVVRKNGWGEVSPGEWHHYLNLQKPVPTPLIQGYAAHWQELQNENAPLRAILNGRLVSVSEMLYDDFILREIVAEADEFREANVIGSVLGKYQLGIGDAWIALRIEKMIEAGELEIASAVTEDMPIYHRVLRKCR